MQEIKIPKDKKQFWVAMYPESYLCQYEEGKENLFGDIDQEKLTQFIFVDRSNPAVPVEIGVDIKIGAITFNNVRMGAPLHEPVKLVYFKRKKVELSVGSKGTLPGAPSLEFHGVGFEFKDSEGKVSKRIIKYKDHTIL